MPRLSTKLGLCFYTLTSTHFVYMTLNIISQKQFSDLRRKWGMKKNTRLGDRQRILKTLDSGGTSEEGHIDTVSLNLEKVKKWRKEAKNGTVVVHRSAPKHKGRSDVFHLS